MRVIRRACIRFASFYKWFLGLWFFFTWDETWAVNFLNLQFFILSCLWLLLTPNEKHFFLNLNLFALFFLNSVHILCWQHTYIWKRCFLVGMINNCQFIHLSLLIKVFFLFVKIVFSREWALVLDVGKSLVYLGCPWDLIWVRAFLKVHVLHLASSAWRLWMIFIPSNAQWPRETLNLWLSSSATVFRYLILERTETLVNLLLKILADIIHNWRRTSVIIIKHFCSVKH